MNVRILNREFKHPADGWYQVEAKGFHPAVAEDGTKVVQVIDDPAITRIVNRFNSDAAAGALPHGSEMLIDHEHFRHDKTKETIAYGWANKLRPSPDGTGFDAYNPWTATGKAAVDGGDYRFTSTEYDGVVGEDFEEVPPEKIPVEVRNRFKDHRFLRPLRLTGLSLTNDANNKGQKAITITNRKTDFPGAVAPGDSKQNNKGQKMKSVCTLLGLSPDAAEDAVLAEVTKLKNRTATLEPLATENTTLKNRNTELEGEQAESLMDAHGMKADDGARVKLKPVLISLKNREDRIAFLKDCVKPAPQAPVKPGQTQLHNRDTKPPGGKAADAATAGDETAQKNLAVKIRNRATELSATKKISFEAAWNQAKQEITAPVE
jgi:hypothetical protein